MRMPFADPVDSSTGRLPRAQRSYAVPESRALEECGCGLVPARWIGEVRDLNRVGFSKPQHQAAGLAADVRIASPFLPFSEDRIRDAQTNFRSAPMVSHAGQSPAASGETGSWE